MVRFICQSGPCDVLVSQIVMFPRTCTTIIPQDDVMIRALQVFIISVKNCAASILLLGGKGPSLRFYHDLRANVVAVGGRVVQGIKTLRSVDVRSRRVDTILSKRRAVLPRRIGRAVHDTAGLRTRSVLGGLQRLRMSLHSGPTVFVNKNDVLLQPFLRGSPLITGTRFIRAPGTGTLNCRVLNEGAVSLHPHRWKQES